MTDAAFHDEIERRARDLAVADGKWPSAWKEYAAQAEKAVRERIRKKLSEEGW